MPIGCRPLLGGTTLTATPWGDREHGDDRTRGEAKSGSDADRKWTSGGEPRLTPEMSGDCVSSFEPTAALQTRSQNGPQVCSVGGLSQVVRLWPHGSRVQVYGLGKRKPDATGLEPGADCLN